VTPETIEEQRAPVGKFPWILVVDSYKGEVVVGIPVAAVIKPSTQLATFFFTPSPFNYLLDNTHFFMNIDYQYYRNITRRRRKVYMYMYVQICLRRSCKGPKISGPLRQLAI
jgi:hypothetical protein